MALIFFTFLHKELFSASGMKIALYEQRNTVSFLWLNSEKDTDRVCSVLLDLTDRGGL